MAAKVLSGARCKVGIYTPSDPATGTGGTSEYIGFFKTVSWGYSIHAEPVYILGKHAPAEIEYTSQDVVQIQASGWRVFGHGAHHSGMVPYLQNLLSHDYIFLTIVDRQAQAGVERRVAVFRHVRPVGYSTSIDARQLEEITVNFMAILVDDESGQNSEHPSAATLEGTIP